MTFFQMSGCFLFGHFIIYTDFGCIMTFFFFSDFFEIFIIL